MDIRELIAYGCDEAGVSELANKISVEWNSRFTKRCGDADFFEGIRMGRVRLSNKLWSTMTLEKQEDLVLHEVAHVIDIYVNGKARVIAQKQGGHGYTWQCIAKKIGAKPERYMGQTDANFAMYRRRITRYPYICKGCGNEFSVSKNIMTRMKRGRRYHCRICKTNIGM